MRALVLLGAVAALVSACKARSGPEPPAIWEPVDEKFTGCAGG